MNRPLPRTPLETALEYVRILQEGYPSDADHRAFWLHNLPGRDKLVTAADEMLKTITNRRIFAVAMILAAELKSMHQVVKDNTEILADTLAQAISAVDKIEGQAVWWQK